MPSICYVSNPLIQMAFYRLFKPQGPAQTLALSLPSHLPQPLGYLSVVSITRHLLI